MDEFCPSCGANVGFGTISIIGCPLCGYGGYEPDNDELEEKENREVPVRHRTRTRSRTKKQPTRKD